MIEMRSVNFHGYTIYEDGTIIGLYGREIKKHVKNGRYEIRLNVEGKRRSYTVSRLMYHAFYLFDIEDRNICVSYKDNNKLNIHLDNLFLAHRSELIQGEGHSNRAKLSDEQTKEIRRLYKGKTGSNQYDKTGYSLQDLADMYGVTKGNIALIVRGESRNEEEYKLRWAAPMTHITALVIYRGEI